MRELQFLFQQLPITAIYGMHTRDTRELVFELEYTGSNKFIMCYIPNNVSVESWLSFNAPKVADTRGINRGNYIHNILPTPELTLNDYANIIHDINNSNIHINKNSYVVYLVDLIYRTLEYEIIEANNIGDARNIAKNIISKQIEENVLVKNLMTDPIRNSRITYTNNLSNSYVGVCSPGYNSYLTHKRYLIGIFKPNIDISKCKQNCSWLRLCR